MNRRQLQKLGIPPTCAKAAIDALGTAAGQGLGMGLKGNRAKELVTRVVANPDAFLADPIWGKLATELLGEMSVVEHEPISYQTWGTDIDSGAHSQMGVACHV